LFYVFAGAQNKKLSISALLKLPLIRRAGEAAYFRITAITKTRGCYHLTFQPSALDVTKCDMPASQGELAPRGSLIAVARKVINRFDTRFPGKPRTIHVDTVKLTLRARLNKIQQ
jgi:hypothetical protein